MDEHPVRAWREELGEEVVLWEPSELDVAIVGYVERPNLGPVACYSYTKLLEAFQASQGMTHEEAVEWISFNVACLWAGEKTPVMLYDFPL